MSIFPKFFFTLFGNALPSWLRSYIARVEGDGGTIVDTGHTKEVYADVSDQIDYLLIANACDAGKLDVLYSFYVEEHPWYVDYIDRILDDGGTVERYAEVYNTYDDLESAGVGEDAFLWLSASSGKTGLLYRMGANTIVYDHEQRVTADSGTTYLPGANARIVQQLVREDLYNDPSIIIPCASGKEGLLYSLLPAVETNTTLLDYHTGSAAAYSLRNLSTSTTNVVKVRRSGDDAELDFTASQVSDGTLAAWVVAGGGTEDGFVTTWYDQSGNTNNATQATAATQPQIVSSGTLLTENGKPACNFRTTRYLGFDISLSGDAFIAGVGSIDITGEAGLIRDGADALYIGWNTSQYRIELNNVRTESATQSIPGQILVAVDVLTSGGQYYVNGISKISFGYTAYTLAQSRIGSALDGSFNVIQEVIIYASDQSANRTGIEANINAHYNIYP